MRLDSLTIGSDRPGALHQFKNLKNVKVDFDQGHWITVVIGWNGTGKSNVLEALAIIFRELISSVNSSKRPKIEFSFQLKYRTGKPGQERLLEIDHDPERDGSAFQITSADILQDGTAAPPSGLSLKAFLNDERALPRYVFSYYSGESTRMHEIFLPYLQKYDEQLRSAKDPGLKRLFYALPVHSQFVLLAFLTGDNEDIAEFLDKQLGLDPKDGLESVLFVLRKPPWKPQPDGDPRFWGAKGVVADFLSRLQDIALAPVETERKVSTSLWNRETLQFKYLFVKDIDALRALVGEQAPAQFFRDLESTFVSQMIDEVRIRVKIKKNDGAVTFRELSEGEQQLLTVLGLMRFTAEDESLFLLDEPDTHLNPRWSADYLSYLKKFIGRNAEGAETSHVVLTTHNPLAVAELLREQVQILVRDKETLTISAQSPDVHPRGMGYAGVVTSELFGLDAAVDSYTLSLLDRKRKLSASENQLDEAQRKALEQINAELESFGFRYEVRDPVYTEYLKARYTRDSAVDGNDKPESSLKDQQDRAKRLVERALKEAGEGGD
jgi:predicted ATPase